MQIKHSATREYSDHLITFQSGLPHVPHQSLQDKGQILLGGGAQSQGSQVPCPTPTGLLCPPDACCPTQSSVFSSLKGGNDPQPRGP